MVVAKQADLVTIVILAEFPQIPVARVETAAANEGVKAQMTAEAMKAQTNLQYFF
jgi:hypothetical protein